MAVMSSEEVLAVVRRWYRAFEAKDPETVFNLMLPSDDFIGIGTDPEEFWRGYQVNLDVFRNQIELLGVASVVERRAFGFVQGETGWVAGEWSFELANGATADIRTTAVLVLVRGDWRIAHFHSSAPIPNLDFVGLELPTTVEVLAEIVAGERPDVAGEADLDGVVTVLFSDIESSTELAESLGDAAWVELLSRYDGRVRAAVDARRGHVVKSMGDGYMVVFRSARDALACALDLQEITEVSTRVGVHLGEALRAADDFFGRTVTVTARIAGVARGGEVLASELVRQVVAGFREVSFVEPRDVPLKGVDGLHLLHRAIRTT